MSLRQESLIFLAMTAINLLLVALLSVAQHQIHYSFCIRRKRSTSCEDRELERSLSGPAYGSSLHKLIEIGRVDLHKVNKLFPLLSRVLSGETKIRFCIRSRTFLHTPAAMYFYAEALSSAASESTAQV